MYCRNCRSILEENADNCKKCGVKKREGFNFCFNCGYNTAIRTEFCIKCGAKQNTVITPQMKKKRMDKLKNELKTNKKYWKYANKISLFGIGIMVILFIFLAVRPQPDSIPELSGLPYSPYGLNDYMSYGSYEVQNYWKEGRAILEYILLSFLISIISFIVSRVYKGKYKRVQIIIKEEKNVL